MLSTISESEIEEESTLQTPSVISDSATSDSTSPAPARVTNEHLVSLRGFCDLNVRKKQVEAKFKKIATESRAKVAETKHKLEEVMRARGLDKACARCPQTGKQVYLTLLPVVTHRRIDANVVRFGIEAFSSEVANSDDTPEFSNTHEMLQFVVEQISRHITAQRRAEEPKFKMVAKKPKKLAEAPFEDISSSVAPLVSVYNKHTAALKKWRDVKKQEMTAIKTGLEKAQPSVMRYLDERGVTSQPVTLGPVRTKYFVRKKVSKTTPAITNKDMVEVIRKAVTRVASGTECSTVVDVLGDGTLCTAIIEEMHAQPKKEQVKLTLDKGAVAKAGKAAQASAPAL